MMKTLLLIVTYALVFTYHQYISYSQSLTVTVKNTSPYPQITSDFLALDKDVLPYSPINETDIRVTENGVQKKIVSLTCPPTNTPLPVSVVLTFDISTSMNFFGGFQQGSGERNIEIAKKAGITFLNALQLPPSECAITSFNNNTYLNSDYTDNRAALINNVTQLTPPPNAGTLYFPAFLDPDFGAIAVAARGKYQSKAIIFLTDGDGRDFFFSSTDVINAAKNAGVKIFCVGLRMPLRNDLITISQQTGGDWFSNVRTTKEAEAIYRRIVQKIQGYAPCEIVWETSGCDTRREAIIEYIPAGLKDTVSYSIPKNSLAQLSVSPLGTPFGIVPVGKPFQKTVYIKSQNADVTVSGLFLTDPRFTVMSPTSFPIIVPKNDSLPVTIQFLPTDTKYSYAELSVISDACNLPIGYFSGGSETEPPQQPTLRIIHPNGKEKFLWKTDTVITWRGVLPQDTVTLEYSIDNGKSWILITDKATGLLHKWKVPATPSKECLMRVTQQVRSGYKPYASVTLPAGIKDIIFTPDDTKFYVLSADSVVRQYNTSDASNNYAINGTKALYMGLNGTGTCLALTISNGNNPQVRLFSSNSTLLSILTFQSSLSTRCLFSGNDTIFIAHRGTAAGPCNINTGSISSLTTINEPGIVTWNDIAPKVNLYISVNPSIQKVSVYNVKNLRSITKEEITLSAEPVRGAIAKDGSSALTTDINGVARLWSNSSKQLITISDEKMFSTAYHPQGLFAITGGLQQTRTNQSGQSENYALAQLFSATGGKIGVLDTHTNTIKSVAVANNGIIATGGDDNMVYLWKINIPQSDVSDDLWEIVAPELLVQDVFMDSVEVNKTRDSLVQVSITNIGTVNTVIRSVRIKGGDSSDFSVTLFNENAILLPGETMPLEFSFSPSAIGLRNAIIEVISDDYTKTANITGEGILIGLEAIPIIDFGKRFLGDDKDTVVNDVLKNTGTIALNFAPARFSVPFNSQFSFVNTPEKFTLNGQESVPVQLQFKPVRVGKVMTILEYGYNRSGSPKQIRVMGEGICAGGADSVIAKADKKAVIPGDTISVAVKLHYPVGALRSSTRPYRVQFDYDSTVLRLLTPLPLMYDTRLASADTVQFFRFLTLLGMDDTARVIIKKFDWGMYCTQSPAILNAAVPIGICRAGGDRLFNPYAQGLNASISPNPPQEQSTITFNTPEKGLTTVDVFSSLGEKVATLLNNIIEPGTYSIEIPISSLPIGTYFITVHTPSQQKTLMIPIR